MCRAASWAPGSAPRLPPSDVCGEFGELALPVLSWPSRPGKLGTRVDALFVRLTLRGEKKKAKAFQE